MWNLWSVKLLVACAYEYFECFDWNEYFEYMKFDLIVGSHRRRRHLVRVCVCVLSLMINLKKQHQHQIDTTK